MTQLPTTNSIEEVMDLKVWQVIVHQSYETIEGKFPESWCDKMLICQHEADEQINRTHSHIMFVAPKVCEEAIRKFIKASGWGGRGNYGIHTVAKESKQPYDLRKLAVYMIKGDIKNIKYSDYTDRDHRNWASEWVTRIPVSLKDGRLVREKVEGKLSKMDVLNIVRSKLDKDAVMTEKFQAEIITTIRQVLVDNNIILGAWKILDYYDSYVMYDKKEHFVEGILSKIKSRQCV